MPPPPPTTTSSSSTSISTSTTADPSNPDTTITTLPDRDPDATKDRPQLTHRQSSTSSHVSLTLSEASSTQSQSHHPSNHHNHHHHQHTRHHRPGRHHGRLGSRNTSFGHNLNKLAHGHASTAKMPNDGNQHSQSTITFNTPAAALSGTTPTATTPTAALSTTSIYARPSHARSRSGDSSGPDASTATSPRAQHPHVKRNASAFIISRNHSHTALKKNHSSGHLPRNLSGRALNKAPPHRPQLGKRKQSTRSEKSVPTSPVSPNPNQQPTVRFALADDEEADSENDDNNDEENEWTEESASVSPNVTRSSTRQNSVMLDPNDMPKEREHHLHDVTSGDESTGTVIHAPEEREANGRRQEEAIKQLNGESSYHPPTRPSALDADAITSRLLQRKVTPQHGAEPQLSSVSAIVQPDAHDHRSLSHSQASTITDGTPGRDLVSRFVNANSADGTPRDGNMLPRPSDSPTKDTHDLDASKRNKSAPNMAAADRGPISPTTTKSSRRSGPVPPSDLPPSRTQQKLLLQRASSAIEPQKHIPAVLPRPGAAQLLGHGLTFTSTEGGTPAQVHALFAQINKEYNVVRRYRNPVADAAARSREIPHPERRIQTKKLGRRSEEVGVPLDGHESPVGSFRSSHDDRARLSRQAQLHNSKERRTPTTTSTPKKEERGHKSRVSFDLPSVKTDDTDDEGNGGASLRAQGGARRDEAYELCRRLWDMGEPEGVAG